MTLSLDSIPEVTPIVEMVDNWINNRRLALVFEAKCGTGKLLYTSIDLNSNIENRPQAKQLLFSLIKYMNSSEFAPKESLNFEVLKQFERDSIFDRKETPTYIY